MAKMLDFSKGKKPTLPVKLPDESILYVYAPTKAMLEEFLELDAALNKLEDNDRESIDSIYEFVARCMSYNKTGRTVAPDELGEMLDIGDLVLFARAYAAFIAELKNEKN